MSVLGFLFHLVLLESWTRLGGYTVFQAGSCTAVWVLTYLQWCLTWAVRGLPLPGAVTLPGPAISGLTGIARSFSLLLLFPPGDFSFHTRNCPWFHPKVCWGADCRSHVHLQPRGVFLFLMWSVQTYQICSNQIRDLDWQPECFSHCV